MTSLDALFEAAWNLGERCESAEKGDASDRLVELAAARWEGAMYAVSAGLLECGQVDEAVKLRPDDVRRGDLQQADVLLWEWAVRTGRITRARYEEELAKFDQLNEARTVLKERGVIA